MFSLIFAEITFFFTSKTFPCATLLAHIRFDCGSNFPAKVKVSWPYDQNLSNWFLNRYRYVSPGNFDVGIWSYTCRFTNWLKYMWDNKPWQTWFKSLSKFSFWISTKLQNEILDQTSASKSWLRLQACLIVSFCSTTQLLCGEQLNSATVCLSANINPSSSEISPSSIFYIVAPKCYSGKCSDN